MFSSLLNLSKEIYQKSGPVILVVWFLLIISGLLDGIGMAMLLPLLNLIGLTTNEVGFVQNLTEHILSIAGFSMNINSVIAFLILIFSIQGTMVIYKGWLIARVEANYVDKWRSELMSLFLNASWPFFLENKLGSLVHMIIVETEKAGRAFFGFAEFVAAIVMLFIYLTASLLISWKFTLCLVGISILLTILFLSKIIKMGYRSGLKYNNQLTEMQAVTTDYFSSIKLIKATGTENTALKNLKSKLKNIRIEYLTSTFLPYALKAVMEFGAIILLFGFLFIGVRYLEVQAGVVLVLLAIFFRMIPRLYHAYIHLQAIGKYLPSFENIVTYTKNAKIFHEKNFDRETIPVNFSGSPKINITNLTVNYGEKTVLSNISLLIPPFKTLGITGESGAGKSTLVDCILGLNRGTKGQILINNEDINNIPIFEWRNSIGYVTQETVLFHDTVKANIIWGNEEVSNSELIDAAKKAHAHDFIQSLAKGYETVVGDKGVCLSGGQRQRIALARALLGKPSLIVLDEATSALDSKSEKEVLDAINDLKSYATIIIISHRLSPLKVTDNILVLDKGMVIDNGAWEELISRNENFIEMLKTPSN